MILKPRKLPRTIKALESINNRLPQFHPSKAEIEKELGQCMAGFHGEKSSDYYLTFLESDPIIICDLRLKYKGTNFQIDTVIVYPGVICILEVKYIKGTIEIRSFYDQTLRTLNGVEEGFPSFKLQAERQSDLLSKWLKLHCNITVPVIPFIVMGNSRTIVKAENVKDLSNTIPMQAIPRTIHQLLSKHKLKKISVSKALSISEKMLQAHEEHLINWYKKFGITFNDLKKGYICPECKGFNILRRARKWQCSLCNITGFHIFEHAIEEAFLLLGDGLTNQQFRKLFETSSSQSVKRLLRKMDLHRTGEGKGTRYYRK
ncbi:nuclease-related domain-containing protein [Jeotgalibacillus terrae]|uniref:Nuclease-related domain-containing protein n=1 Tax=Jeotgalibacillus terrae TaxID=587735 RepID=A0ABW5ZBY1_9BACL|nr:nuclease-related domain-containing protein [Jeotgalibacillus terrae]MBM7577913.1 rubredoxin [Jeotgalibacillus terrae]